MRKVFELEIWHKQDEQACLFLLLWEDRRKKLTATLPYVKDIRTLYRRWQKWYLRFYELTWSQGPGNSGQLNLGSGDLAYDLMKAEKELLHAFQSWLGDGALRDIRQQIQGELIRATQSSSSSAEDADSQPRVDVFLACESEEMARLPWEAWQLASDIVPPDTLRIVRTSMDVPEESPVIAYQPRKPRILAVLGDDPHLPLQDDWKTVRSLKPIADIERFIRQPNDSVSTVKKKFADKICDRRGWDILFFAGHSDDTAVTGGQMVIAPNISLSISEIEDYLTAARDNGLQLAIFNSCNGLSIANSLVSLGLQVVVMREPIRHDVAKSLLKPLCQQLAQHRDIHDALLSAKHYLQSTEKFAYPSAHLIPSFFSPVGQSAYRIKPFGWRRHIRQWLPTKREAIALSTITLMSLMVPVQDMLLDLRTAAQGNYRSLTRQIPTSDTPPVTLITIDQQSLNQADETIEGFEIKPLDREYLSQIIDQLTKAKADVVGIDYFLDQEKPKESILADSIRRTVQTQNTWFIFATRDKKQKWTRDEIASPNWSLEADPYLAKDRIKLPKESTCAQSCPFAYSLVLADRVNQQTSFKTRPRPTLNNDNDLRTDLSLYLRNFKDANSSALQVFLDRVTPPLALPYIIDFSIPPHQIYRRIPAWQFLSNPIDPNDFAQQIVIVASDRYIEADDQFSAPTAFRARCYSVSSATLNPETCSKKITGGELHAYMVHHFLNSHLIILIPDWWMVFLSILLSKGTLLYLLKTPTNHRKQLFILLAGLIGYGLLSLQLYLSAAILVPIFLPSVIVSLYIFPILRQKFLSNATAQLHKF